MIASCRSEAREMGLARYRTGEPCIRGHIAERRVRDAHCTECEREKKRAEYAASKAKYKERHRQRYLLRGEEIRERSRKWAAENPEKREAQSRRAQGHPEPDRPRPEQCECCGRPPGKKALGLDHCHNTGVFRGWLCGNCNMGIGLLGDSTEGLQRAMGYLLSHNIIEEISP